MSGLINLKSILKLALGDFKNVSRDPILAMVLFAPVLISLVFRIGIPFLTEFLKIKLHFNLEIYYIFINSMIILLPSQMFGMITGFMLLDERDEQILSYIAVTPLTKSGFIIYRVMSSCLLSFVFCFYMLKFTALAPFNPINSIPAALLVALETPLMTLFLAAFAANKVEGLTFAKGLGIMFCAPLLGFFIRSDWALLAGVFPPYWVSKTYMAGFDDGFGIWFYFTVGLMVHLCFIWFLLRRFNAKAS